MMKRSAYTVHYGSLSVGEHDLEFNLADEFFSQFEGGEILNGNCNTNILLNKHSSFLELSISIEGKVDVQCDRCLEDLSMPINFTSKLIVKFSPEIDQPEFEINAEQEDIIYVNTKDTKIDLSQYFFDSVNLSLPFSRIHEEDENGETSCNAEMLAMFIRSK